ncbi:MAG: GTP cyclohydrolase I FolE [Lachnospiraceae bacterium]|jgi:GTP cyclohydrolase I|nr:GTP cyclohydrolase I FolE [Lachnospiraceae bacterium]MCR5117397.1 GTP cyclohydrolase I FolE [Lachnospiraceae bacterium]
MFDDDLIKEGVKSLIEGMGENPEREGLVETPDRIARMYHEIFAGYEEDPGEILKKRFKVDNSEMVLERDIVFFSMCEHHMLPFFGHVHIAYIPNGEVVGLSKLARCVEVYARRLQLQERMTSQIADAINKYLSPKGVMVVVEAEHMCMTMRGVKKPGSTTTTIATRGEFAENKSLQWRFFDMLKR